MIYIIRSYEDSYIIGIFYSSKEYNLQEEYNEWVKKKCGKKQSHLQKLHLDDFIKEYELEELPMQVLNTAGVKYKITNKKLPSVRELLNKYETI